MNHPDYCGCERCERTSVAAWVMAAVVAVAVVSKLLGAWA